MSRLRAAFLFPPILANKKAPEHLLPGLNIGAGDGIRTGGVQLEGAGSGLFSKVEPEKNGMIFFNVLRTESVPAGRNGNTQGIGVIPGDLQFFFWRV